MHREQLEALALRFVANGAGCHPVPDCDQVDEAVVLWVLGHDDRVHVALRKQNQTRYSFEFTLSAVAPMNHSSALGEIKRVDVQARHLPFFPDDRVSGLTTAVGKLARHGRLFRRRRAALRLMQHVLELCPGSGPGLDPVESQSLVLLHLDRLVRQCLITRSEHAQLGRFFAEFLFPTPGQ